MMTAIREEIRSNYPEILSLENIRFINKLKEQSGLRKINFEMKEGAN